MTFAKASGESSFRKAVDLLGRGRQADEVVSRPADQRPPVGRRRGGQVLFIQPGQDERVDFISDFALWISYLRDGWTLNRAEGPELPGVFDIEAVRLGRVRTRVGRAHLHPGDEVGDLGIRQFLFGHLEVVVDVPHRADEQALLGMAGNDGRTGGAALEQPGPRIEIEFAANLLRAGGMAFVAMLDEEGADSLLEERDALGRWVRRKEWPCRRRAPLPSKTGSPAPPRTPAPCAAPTFSRHAMLPSKILVQGPCRYRQEVPSSAIQIDLRIEGRHVSE